MKVSRPVPWLTEVGVGAFLGAAVLLLVLRPDYDPLRRYLSEYGVGPGGWAMRVGFVLLGLASLNLVAGFRGDPGPADGRAVGWALAVWGAADLAPLTRGFAIATPAAFVLEASLFSTLGWVGLGQWPLYGLAAGWLLLLARRFHRLRRLSGR